MVAKTGETSPSAEETKAVGAAANTSLANVDFFEGGGSEAMEDFGAQDFTVPYMGILQALSKPLQKGHAKYNKDAKQGQFINSATGQLIEGGEPGRDKNGNWNEGGFIYVPVYFHHRYLEWKPNNGGIAHDYGEDPTRFLSIKENEKRERITPEGNEIIDAMEYFGFIVNPETQSFEAAVVTFAKSSSTRGKKWNNSMRQKVEMTPAGPKTPAIYYYAYRFTTIPVSNDKGSWFAYNIEDYAKIPEWGEFGGRVFTEAKKLRDSVKSGELSAAVEEPTAGGTDHGDGDGAF